MAPPGEARRSTSKGRSKAASSEAGASSSIVDSFAKALERTPPKPGRPVHAASVEYRYRAPHTAFGRSGYSQVSNDFLSEVLAVLIARHGMSPAQSAVLVFCMGRQREGRLRITHVKVAKHLGIERANVTRALSSLESWHMVQRRPNSLLVVNPLICFKGNGDIQQAVLDELRADAAKALRDAFPEMREDALEVAALESFPEFQPPAAPKPRTRQLEFEDTDVEGQAC
ncbi:replication/maintenance protein RepL [Streptomyces sp. H27-H1]|uniref:replication/maintenance protein RepL n=1 Tax=Streptomyces sp. H27-H1 TaxID=2996461 RepID=UPI00226E45F2|nr:replication/maintenance protein RepL [Streptomyces sp. H27-H1]MCY0932528.1 replication/maintenance protein RepL [Streptomyces sp. H27-H1]